MEKIRRFYRYLRGKYDLLAFRKYTTVAGTLVFFLILSLMPLAFWLTLLIGRLPVDTEELLSLPVFDSVKNVLLYVQKEATDATAGASVFLMATTLYSSTTLFYQIRRSGEIIYDFHREKQGLRIRLGAFILLVLVMALAVLYLLVFAFGSFLFSRLLSDVWELVADYILLAAVAFLLVLLLNMYICPYKAKMRRFLPGTALTVVAWIGAVIGFSVYLKISNVGRLYGALSTVIVFLLWLYVLMICFIVGVIFNSEKILAENALQNGKQQKGKNASRTHKGIKKPHTVRDEKG